jgi:hypothetical protein
VRAFEEIGPDDHRTARLPDRAEARAGLIGRRGIAREIQISDLNRARDEHDRCHGHPSIEGRQNALPFGGREFL